MPVSSSSLPDSRISGSIWPPPLFLGFFAQAVKDAITCSEGNRWNRFKVSANMSEECEKAESPEDCILHLDQTEVKMPVLTDVGIHESKS